MKAPVAIDPSRVRAFADFFSSSELGVPFDFCTGHEGDIYPDREAEGVLELFFFTTAHQFGFWYEKGGRYDRPMVARLEGREYKGSDYLSRCTTRAWQQSPLFFSPEHLATVSDARWNEVFSDDSGINPLPQWHEHLDLIHRFTRWFSEHATTPSAIVSEANASPFSLSAFLELASSVPGYGEDPMQKKLQLLAIILENRPERFLRVPDPEAYRPIIDYHLQRSALRTGLIGIEDPGLRQQLVDRKMISADEEKLVREHTYEAIRQILDISGCSLASLDYFFFANRTRCPEMSQPACNVCPVQAICARKTELFQPVFRTTAY